ncbi:MAG: hypothetical protein KJ970_16425 [Candidatus Eisenbacteria bacterium]|uniref:Uncharacterized protein n=1 Tax=Eiseniibacteriota bacterium TaxID=2212470 RepID=A0A948RZJ0_UNCEI|nr:hypothetical protein [Candidatus Eisenbacteria bacterium]MBU1951159.1 hypothetical protein [Candidatus Eisenbacteria bacterium]MBU2692507.1 hypothetical protein [Candidatus Eisenbacteria bacterium]
MYNVSDIKQPLSRKRLPIVSMIAVMSFMALMSWSSPGLASPDRLKGQTILVFGRDSVDTRVNALRDKLWSREELSRGLAELFFWEIDYQDGPILEWAEKNKNTADWIVMTDDLSDTISTQLYPLLKSYTEIHPDELLTEGRQQFELANITLNPPPTRMLGFHVTRLGRFLYAKSDSLIMKAGVQDREGVYDGYIRFIWDWVQQFHQCHEGIIQKHTSRITQEDWIVARLKPNCPEGKRFRVIGQYMALDPDIFLYKHRFVIMSEECGEQRTIEIPLPHFKLFMEEVQRLSEEEKGKLLEDRIKRR